MRSRLSTKARLNEAASSPCPCMNVLGGPTLGGLQGPGQAGFAGEGVLVTAQTGTLGIHIS